MASPLQRELNKSGMWQRRLEPKVAGQALSTGKMKAQQTEAAKEAAVDPPWKKCVCLAGVASRWAHPQSVSRLVNG